RIGRRIPSLLPVRWRWMRTMTTTVRMTSEAEVRQHREPRPRTALCNLPLLPPSKRSPP
ncbi:MAG: hypothetical protein M1823_008362, partial [Watsoniomyces obsoletus]